VLEPGPHRHVRTGVGNRGTHGEEEGGIKYQNATPFGEEKIHGKFSRNFLLILRLHGFTLTDVF
jgi:hypothetical protein